MKQFKEIPVWVESAVDNSVLERVKSDVEKKVSKCEDLSYFEYGLWRCGLCGSEIVISDNKKSSLQLSISDIKYALWESCEHGSDCSYPMLREFLWASGPIKLKNICQNTK
jgi:hypothetical protein